MWQYSISYYLVVKVMIFYCDEQIDELIEVT